MGILILIEDIVNFTHWG